MKHILYLPSWFPNKNDPYTGDFIMRHAEAASLYNKITVLFALPDYQGDKEELVQIRQNSNMVIFIQYFPVSTGLFRSWKNAWKRYKSLKKLFRKHLVNIPDLVHVHVSWPAGLLALYLKKRHRLAYVLTEHETIFLPEYDKSRKRSVLEKILIPTIFNNARKIHAVSNTLLKALQNRGLARKNSVVIPNVVDTDLFYPSPKPQEKTFRFIHVSGLTYQKNPEGMLQAFAEVSRKRTDFLLTILGPYNKKLRDYANQLGLENNVIFKGEIPHPDVAREIQNSDAMIHFARYETFGCVVAESLCCGVPVIASNLAVMRELVDNNRSGILVEEGNKNDLADKILLFMDGRFSLDPYNISGENRSKFNYSRIGKIFDELYSGDLSASS